MLNAMRLHIEGEHTRQYLLLWTLNCDWQSFF